ncbi:MAG TPA: hypothetical protein VMV05_07155, partial [bacterium]|nr:hypothetical protein [bacterium]
MRVNYLVSDLLILAAMAFLGGGCTPAPVTSPTGPLTETPTPTRTATGTPTGGAPSDPTPTSTATATFTHTLTATFTPTPTVTLSATAATSFTPTVTVSPCANTAILGDAVAGSGGVTHTGGTLVQKYVLAQAAAVSQINVQVMAPVLMSVGIYGDYNGSYPLNLLWASAPQSMAAGLNSVAV